MKALAAILAALIFALAAPALTHGDNKHGEEKAPPVSSPAAQPTTAAGIPAELDIPEAPAPDRSALSLAENLHPATVHFPIALLLVAALVELLAAMRASQSLHHAARVMAVAGGIGAVVASLFGWIHTGLWWGGGSTMQLHRWSGTALGLLGFVIAWLGWKKHDAIKLFRLFLLLGVVGVLAQGFLGGELGHGAGHLWK